MEALDPDVIARVEQLTLAAKEASLGAISGIHSAKRRGTSVEFAEHKEYAPGDDVRRIDWRAYARFDRYYLKQFQDEANLKVYVVFDASGSMGYGDGTRGTNKLAYARTLAAGLCHLALSQRDAVGLMTLADGGREFLPARTRSSHFEEIVHRLVRAQPKGKGALAAGVTSLTELVRGRGLCIVISDLLDRARPGDQSVLDALEVIAARGIEVSVLHVQHPDERDFPFETPAFFSSMEDSRRMFVQPRVLQKMFVQEMQRYRQEVAVRLSAARIDHQLAWTDGPPAELLSAYLSRRMHLLRVRA
ncbi:MAG: DUF58 domain-containing protein [Deltaproteobacteria bacterium]|nr:DUF58 domain-containing protein [Deltaproteobacteria bacterium]